MQNKLLKIIDISRGFVVPLLFIVLWESLVRKGVIPHTLIAPPSEVLSKLVAMAHDGSMFVHSYVSLRRLFLGMIIGTSLGVFAGALVGYSKLFASYFERFVLILMPIPPIAWIPLLIVFLGIGEGSKIALISIGSFCVLFLKTAYAIRNADRKLVEVALVLQKKPFEMFFKVLLPSALPDILSSCRIALALSWGLLMSSEIIASSKGLGWLIWDARNFARPDEMIAGMVIAGICGKMTDMLLVRAEKHITRWQDTYGDI